MDNMVNFLDKDIFKIITVFSVSQGSRMRRNFIKEKTGMNNIILDKTLISLVNFKVLIKDKNFYSLNFENVASKDILEICKKEYAYFKQLPLKIYFMILEIREELMKIREMGDFYLFGSYSKLIYNANSDIDIAIISDSINKKEAEKLIKKLEKKYNKVIEVHYFSRAFYNNKRDPLVKEILQHGIKMI